MNSTRNILQGCAYLFISNSEIICQYLPIYLYYLVIT